MIYINNDSTDPYFNFALEYYLLNEFNKFDSFFMLWRTEPTLMIGRYQNTFEEINNDFVQSNNINVVRRITGGGTIYTDLNGWQYSFINKNTQGNKQNIDFKTYIEPVIEALDAIGVKAYFNNRNDILIDEKKFSGNAQYIRKNSVLHHGSILYDTNLENLVRALNVSDEKIISKGIKSVRDRVTNVKDHMPDQSLDSIGFRNVLLDTFLKKCTDEYVLTGHDLNRIMEIKLEKFQNPDWIYGNNPLFNIEKESRFAGGLLQVKLIVEHNKIKKCNIYGDFFAQGNISIFESQMQGISYDQESIKKALEHLKASDYFYNITTEEIQSCFI